MVSLTDGEDDTIMAREREPTPGMAARRACDRCRMRKIRCDRLSPCSNCRAVHRSCSSQGLGPPSRESRQRVLISAQYERKIDGIESRLASLDQLLRNGRMASNCQHAAERAEPSPARPPSPSTTTGDHPSTVLQEGGPDISFEGHSSMAAATAFANDFLQNAVSRTPVHSSNAPMQTALSSLKHMASMQHRQPLEVRLPHKKPLPQGGLKGLTMPPVQPVLAALREMKEAVVEYCQKVYFAMEEFSCATFIIVNATLRYLFQERARKAEDAPSVGEYLDYSRLCRDNLETALSTLGFLLPANVENVEALLLGSTYAIESSRPSLAWQLNSGAAQLCQTLGWHRLSSNIDDCNGRQASLFWMTYMLDKGLALRLGRASVMQDHEISLPKRLSTTGLPSDWHELLCRWIRHAELSGRAYLKLYSPESLRQPAQKRIDDTLALISDLNLIAGRPSDPILQGHSSEASNRGDSRPFSNDGVTMLLKSDEVWYWTTLTLIHRATPPTADCPVPFSAACLESARMAFRTHQQCMRMTGVESDMRSIYLLWTITYTPFIPFIVLFCHVIETSNLDDLSMLRDFVNSLKAQCPSSEAVQRHYELCNVLYNVAALYVEVKSQNSEDQNLINGNEFDVYFNALGLISDHDHHVMPSAMFDGFMTEAGNHAANLRDWFAGNAHMASLVEENFPQFRE